MLRRLPFARLVREICTLYSGGEVLRWNTNALDAIQAASEAFLTGILSDSNLCALHAKRVTLMVRDLRLVRRLKGPAFY